MQFIPLEFVTVGCFLRKLAVSFLCDLKKSVPVRTRFFGMYLLGMLECVGHFFA
jgi:hypothetical protein